MGIWRVCGVGMLLRFAGPPPLPVSLLFQVNFDVVGFASFPNVVRVGYISSRLLVLFFTLPAYMRRSRRVIFSLPSHHCGSRAVFCSRFVAFLRRNVDQLGSPNPLRSVISICAFCISTGKSLSYASRMASK